MVILGQETDYDQPLLGLIPMKVKRNGFGRQKASFEAELELKITENHYLEFFIKAPYALTVSKEAVPLGKIHDKIIAVAYKNHIATAFHPNLLTIPKFIEYFIKEVLNCVE